MYRSMFQGVGGVIIAIYATRTSTGWQLAFDPSLTFNPDNHHTEHSKVQAPCTPGSTSITQATPHPRHPSRDRPSLLKPPTLLQRQVRSIMSTYTA